MIVFNELVNSCKFKIKSKLRDVLAARRMSQTQNLYQMTKRRKIESTTSSLRKLFNWKYTLKVIVVLCGFFGFMYQSSEYFVKYLEYPTLVDVHSERNSIVDIPSVTLCIPSLTSRKHLTKEYPEIVDKLEAIRKDNNPKTVLIKERKLFRLYENRSAATKTPQQFFGLGIHAEDIIECKVLRPQFFENLADEWINCTDVSQVLETIGPNGKCFTYFTKLNKNESNGLDAKFKIDMFKSVRDQVGLVIQIKLTLNPNEYIDVAKVGDESVTLHETTGVPSEGKRRKLKAGTTYDIFFTKILTTSLPIPYKTDCIDYEMFNRAVPQSRVDCVDRCVKDIYYDVCNCYPIHVVVRHDIVINRNLSLCNDTTNDINVCKQMEVNSRCFEKCKLDCYEVKYDFDTEEDVHPSDKELQESEGEELVKLMQIRNSTAMIRLWRKVSGDTLYEYKKELPLVQMFSFVGGLASLWLGISVVAVYDFMVRVAQLIYRTKPFEKMRQRDTAIAVLSKWSNNVRRLGRRKSKIIKLTVQRAGPVRKTPIMLNPV